MPQVTVFGHPWHPQLMVMRAGLLPFRLTGWPRRSPQQLEMSLNVRGIFPATEMR
jgi:hypothetical protein